MNSTPIREMRRLVLADRAEGLIDLGRQLPATRADCVDGPRPCPFVSCRHHLYLDVSHVGSVDVLFPDTEPGDLDESCALDVAESGPILLDEIGSLLNCTRQRVAQIEADAIAKLSRATELWDHLSP